MLAIKGSGETFRFDYDERGRITLAATDANGVHSSYYDSLGRPLGEQRDGKGVEHQYDLEVLTHSTLVDRFPIRFDHQADGVTITDPTGGVHRFRCSRDGLASRALSNGTRELAQYDAEGRCLRKLHLDASSKNVWQREFAYSGEGDLLSVADSRSGETRYEYDGAHRLTGRILPDGAADVIRYEAAGNLLSHPGIGKATYDAGNRLLRADGDNDRDHVASRTGADGDTRYEYNARDQLIGCVGPGLDWSAEYDPLGRRIRKRWNDGRSVEFFWDGDRLAAELRDDERLRVYVYCDAAALVAFLFVDYDSPDADPESGRVYYLLTDQIGCPTRVEDGDGKSVWSATIDPYGTAHIDRSSTIDLALRRPGQYYDEETGLCDNRFRSYCPRLGRFLQSDPLGVAGGLNLYAYPANPLADADLLGLHGSLRGAFERGVRKAGAVVEAVKTRADWIRRKTDFSRSGVDDAHIEGLRKFCKKDPPSPAIIRFSNADGAKHLGKNADPKPLAVKFKTSKKGKNAGLVTKDAQRASDGVSLDDVRKMNQQGKKLLPDHQDMLDHDKKLMEDHYWDSEGVLRQNGSNKVYAGDYDMQGMYRKGDDGKYQAIDGDPDFPTKMNDEVFGPDGPKMFQPNANDSYRKADGSPGRHPEDGESYLVVDELGNARMIDSTKNLKKFYGDLNIKWPYGDYPKGLIDKILDAIQDTVASKLPSIK